MTPAEYLSEVLRTIAPGTPKEALHLGLLGESGEVADLVKKHIAQGHPLSDDKLIKELGDVLWYTTAKLVEVGGRRIAADLLARWHDVELPDTAPGLAIKLCAAAAKLGPARYPFELIAPTETILSIVGELGRRLQTPVSVAGIMRANVNKLRKRYPEGFSTEASLKKADDAP